MNHHMGRLERGESETETYERRYIRSDGSVVPTEVTVSAARDEDGRVACFIGVVDMLLQTLDRVVS